MANNPLQELQIRNNSANNLLAQELSRDGRQEKLRLHEKARDKVSEGQLDPPEEVSDEMIQEGLQRKDVEEGNYLRNPENIQNIMNIVGKGITTYKTLQQIPLEIIKTLLLQGLGQRSLAQDSLKIGNQNLASTPQDGRAPSRLFYNRPYESPDLFIKTPDLKEGAKKRFMQNTGIPLAKRKKQKNVA